MKITKPVDLDNLDRGILEVLQEDCKTPLVKIGERVGLSAPAVVERVHKLEEAGIIRGYHALLDGRRVGLDVTAFVGVTLNHQRIVGLLETSLGELPQILEAHYITGDHALLLKVKVQNSAALESLLARLRTIPGIECTHTMIALSSPLERVEVMVSTEEEQRTAAAARRKS